MFTLLHLSDLHRAAAEPFTNDEIISALIADAERYVTEVPPIARPDAIIISGDLVHGLPLRSANYPAALVEQYDAAFELLSRLTDTFLSGDHSKLIMIPGNHDVDFNCSLGAMNATVVESRDLKSVLFGNSHDNLHRWCWDESTVYRIENRAKYDDRFRFYCDMFNKFYDGVTLPYQLDPTGYSNLFELDQSRIVVAAFNSCFQNDCFNHVGDIPRAEIAKAHLAIAQSGKPYQLKMAVWHHDIAGPPGRSDYMDPEIVKLMIDKGFRLGLHGHQHKPHATPESVYTARRASMVVVRRYNRKLWMRS